MIEENLNLEKDRFKLPEWVARPPNGSHLDVFKEKQLLQKLLVDEKGAYYFGRNPAQCDFVVEHASCSRVHAILLYHKLLKKFALVDLDSSHGTFVANIRIEQLKPVFLDFDTTFNFGASTRKYTLKSRIIKDSVTSEDNEDENMEYGYNLPEKELELENLTEYNTAHNRRISQIPITLEEARRKSRPRNNIQFAEEEDIINPEDVDPTIGRFRNMVRTAVIPANISNKRARAADVQTELFEFYTPDTKRLHHKTSAGSADEKRKGYEHKTGFFARASTNFLSGLVPSVNAAPDLDLYAVCKDSPVSESSNNVKFGTFSHSVIPDSAEMVNDTTELHRKKKYAKEAWPGRKSNVL